MNANITTQAVESLTDALARSAKAGDTVLVKAYGNGTDTAAVKLALSAARQLAGLAKPAQGGAGQRVNDTVRIVRSLDVASALDDAQVIVSAARTVLDKHRANVAAKRAADKVAKQIDSDTRAAAKAVLNDRGAAKSDRIAALEVMAEIDAKPVNAKNDAAREAFARAVSKFRDAGFNLSEALSILDTVYPVEARDTDLVNA